MGPAREGFLVYRLERSLKNKIPLSRFASIRDTPFPEGYNAKNAPTLRVRTALRRRRKRHFPASFG